MRDINLGRVTAYADAVAAGYTGTREQFAVDLANAATYAGEAGASAEAAAASETAAANSAEAAEAAAQVAAGAEDSVHADALAAQEAKAAAQASEETAVSKAGEAANSADSARNSASAASSSASAAATSEQNASGSATAAAGSATAAAASETAAAESAEEAAESLGEVQAAETSALTNIDTAKTTALSEIQTKGEETRASIPADYTALSDDVNDLKSDLEKYDNPFEETIPGYTSGIIGISIIDPAESNYTSYRISAIRKNSSWHWFMTLQGYNGTDWVNIDNIASQYSAGAVYPMVETLFSNYNKYAVVIDWNYVRTEDISTSGITEIVLKNTVVNKPFVNALVKINTNQTDIANLTTNEQMYNSVFSVPVNSNALGIVDINLYNPSFTNYEKYRINILRHNSSYHLHLVLQGCIGETWTNIDSILVRAENAPEPLPAVEVLDSTYHRFTVTIIWAMMGTLTLTGLDYQLKNSIVNRTQIALQTRVEDISNIPSFELADHIKHVVTVKPDGTGDYTTIADAYAAITDSAWDNQYEIIVYPGTYNENNLQPPAYTHTHGIYPMQTIVDSSGLFDPENPDLSVFDQGHAPSKLSNMVIRSQTKYCVHQDVELKGVTLVNENLYCIRLTGGSSETSVIGIGADFDGAKFVWRNCTFVNGAVAAHTNPNNLPNANQHIIYENCIFVDAYVSLMVAGIGGGASGNTFGEYVCEIKGCTVNEGRSGLNLKFGYPVSGIDVNFPWQIIGGNNNFAPVFNNSSDTSAVDFWDAISTTDKTYAIAAETIAKGSFVAFDGTKATSATDTSFIAGLAVSDGAQNDRVQVWKAPFVYTGNNGEYGLDATGNLDSGASNKIGRVFNNIFYPFYG